MGHGAARTIVHTAQLILNNKFQVAFGKSPRCEIRRGIASIFLVIQAFDWGNADVEPSQVDLSKVTVPHALYLAQVISTCQ